MKDTEITIWILAGMGLLVILYLINDGTDGFRPVPGTQGEGQFEALNIKQDYDLASGTPLDTAWENHGWHPGHDPVPAAQPVTQSRHRYPSVPGGNISTVMHKGWSTCVTDTPGGKSNWFLTPPEAAII
jgi:hypothetical protein